MLQNYLVQFHPIRAIKYLLIKSTDAMPVEIYVYIMRLYMEFDYVRTNRISELLIEFSEMEIETEKVD